MAPPVAGCYIREVSWKLNYRGVAPPVAGRDVRDSAVGGTGSGAGSSLGGELIRVLRFYNIFFGVWRSW